MISSYFTPAISNSDISNISLYRTTFPVPSYTILAISTFSHNFQIIRTRPPQIRYRNQKKSLFEEWVRELDRKFESEGRNNILLIDNCPAHPEIGNLKALALKCLRPNTTSRAQLRAKE